MATEETKPPSEAVNPFISKEATCPICEKRGFQRKIKAHLFPEKNRDIDMRPLNYQRAKKGLEHIHPLVYYLWHCPHCQYTAWPGAFENPVKAVPLAMGKYRAALIEPPGAEKAAGRVWKRLTAGLDTPDLDFFLGVQLHLLAIFQLLLVQGQTGVRDSFNMGRYYLRLSWLFRELEEQAELKDQAQQVQALLRELRQDWPQAPGDSEAAATRAAQEYEAALGQSNALENLSEVCDLMLLITRIHIKLKRVEPARLTWGKAHELARGVENSKRSLEDQYYKLQDQTRSATKVLADAAKAAMPEVSAKIVEMDALARAIRNKTQEVRNLLHDLSEDLGSAPAAGQEAAPEEKPKKKRFGFFKKD